MATPPSRSAALDRSPSAIKVDNLLRQSLKISDPYDPAQIAEGLRKHYVADAGLEERERQGLPAIRAPLATAAAPMSAGPISLETDQGLDDLEQDLRAILQESQLKDVRAELQGWARAIRAAASDGLSAARSSRDPGQRDRAFSARRTLADYARLLRYVGALSGGLSPLYRRLAQSCDVVASLTLVCCGEALAAVGIVRSSFILQAPVSELQTRRDAALTALRNLVGSTQYAHGPNEWPRGLDAYRHLMTRLDESGQSELRSLFSEADLGRLFDELIDMAAGSSTEGLRALGATAMVSLERVNRLVAFANPRAFTNAVVTGSVTPESPPLATFLSALRLFVEAFESANRGYRLVYIARPAILTYGLYGQAGIDPPTERLLDLISLRNRLAEQIDCLMRCDSSEDTVRRQLWLDKILFDLDRAIDYYALGGSTLLPYGGEVRSAAYGALIQAFIDLAGALATGSVPSNILSVLAELQGVLQWPSIIPPPPLMPPPSAERTFCGELLHQELSLHEQGEKQWERLARALAPRCIDLNSGVIIELLTKARTIVFDKSGVAVMTSLPIEVTIPPHFETSLNSIVNDA